MFAGDERSMQPVADPIGPDLAAFPINSLQTDADMLTGGLDLHYEVRGEGRPLVLLHGFGATTYTWNHGLLNVTQRFHST